MRFSDDLKQYLESVSFAVLCVTLNLGDGEEVLVIVKSTKDLIGKLKGAAAPVRLGWLVEPSEAGPVLCMCIKSRVKGVGELMGECYLDPLSLDDIEQLEQMCQQEQLKVAFFDEDMEIAWVATPGWTMIDRLYAEQSLDKARALSEDVTAPDFQQALDTFKETVPLERLEGAFLPEEAAGDGSDG
jgi:hypothetical protein